MRTFLGLDRAHRRRQRARLDPTAATLHRLQSAVAAIVGVVCLGTIGYLLLGFTLLEAVYQTITTVATVGFREVRPLDTTGQIFTMVLIVLGAGTVLYCLGLIVEAVTEGHLRSHLERRRMDNQIATLRNHIIICGYGRVGRAAAEQLQASGHQVVLIDRDPARLAGLTIPHLIGDATTDELLREAGIERARALIATLDSDADTVYLTLSARALCPSLVIVSRARTTDSKQKLVLAGADRAVNPQRIGGRRLATFALQPHVADFLDVATHDELDFKIHQTPIRDGSPLAGHTLAELDLPRRTGAQLLAVRDADLRFTANPPPDTRLAPGMVLIAFGGHEHLAALATLAAETATPSAGGLPVT